MYFKMKYTDAGQRPLHAQCAGNLLCDQFLFIKLVLQFLIISVILLKALYKLAFVVVGYKIILSTKHCFYKYFNHTKM